MRLALLSDIHANWAALEAVWADLKEHDVNGVYTLGDNVGYGPSPQDVVAFLHTHGVLSIQGNHERGLVASQERAWFNPHARQGLEQTRSMMSPEWIQVLAAYPLSRVVENARLVHGCPPDSPFTYLFEYEEDLAQLFEMFEETICFVGHTHELKWVRSQKGQVTSGPLNRGVLPLDKGARYMVNIGSVGQPRDGDNRAKYVIWDTHQSTLSVRFVSYDIQDTVDKIMAQGLPQSNATRLW
ncbi:MAG: metallophosphoesterase family protein [Thermodesulfobacteriota bacterium]